MNIFREVRLLGQLLVPGLINEVAAANSSIFSGFIFINTGLLTGEANWNTPFVLNSPNIFQVSLSSKGILSNVKFLYFGSIAP